MQSPLSLRTSTCESSSPLERDLVQVVGLPLQRLGQFPLDSWVTTARQAQDRSATKTSAHLT